VREILTNRFGESAGPFYLTVVAFALLAPLVTGSVSTAGAVLVFAIAAAACNLMLGYAGLLSFAQGSFFGVGSYVVGITLKAYPGVGLGALVVCVVAGMLVALAISALSIRQRGIYFVMITLAMAQLAFFASLALPGWTGGENGLLDIPRPMLGLEPWLGESRSQYALAGVVFVAVLAFLRRVVRSPFGRSLDAVRENEVRAQTAGFDIKRLKLVAFCISGGLTALAGALYALQLRSAPLSNIDLMTSETILVMAILGGRRSLIGAAFGALAMTLMAEQLSQLWPRWQMIVGFVLIATVLFAPNGLGGLWAQFRATQQTRAKEAT
jgi:branched-chain amino acid transport system permease protein